MTSLEPTWLCRIRAVALAIGTCAAAFIAGCGGGDDLSSGSLPSTEAPAMGGERQSTGPTAPMPQPGEALIAPAAPLRASGALAVANGGYTVDTSDRQAVKLFYRSVFASSYGIAEGWTGSVAACDAGDVSLEYRSAALRRLNWFRAMAGVPANIQWDAAYNRKAQAAALIMSANNATSHYPPPSWQCYTAEGYDGAAHSNLSLGVAGLPSIDRQWIHDWGDINPPVEHRRWVLYPQAQYMGLGSVARAAALFVVGGFAAARPAVRDEFVAWPPKGYVPYQTVYPRWSLSYPGADFSAATVTMTENGTPIATRLEALKNPRAGENTIVWFPGSYTDGSTWVKPAADKAYQVNVSNVKVSGVARTFTYTTTVFDGDEALTPTLVSGPSKLVVAQEGGYSVAAAPHEAGWQWRSLIGTPFTFADGAEAGTASFAVSTSGTYDVASADTAATGARSFHLAGATGEHILQLRQPLIIREGGSLSFSSRLGFATPAQSALLEMSLDEGRSWTALYQQAGVTGTSEPSFSAKAISLSPYAGRSALLRWRYAILPGMSVYPQTTSGVGWYIDNISLQGVDAQTWAGSAVEAPQGGFSLTPVQSGTVYLQGRGRAYGYPLEWGRVYTVSVNAAGRDPFDCVLNWAEQAYPDLLYPASPAPATLGPYYYRAYPATNSYVGLSAADDHVYFLNGGVMQDLGAQERWLTAAGCRTL